MIEIFRKAAGIERELPALPFNSPVFLTGCMRSGTSFLSSLLSEHPELLLLEGELNKVWTEIGGADCLINRQYADREMLSFEKAANMVAYFERCRLEFRQNKYYLWRLVNKKKKGSGGVQKHWNKLHLLTKNVHLINRIDYVMNMFPQAKMLLIIRPIEAQVNSLKLHFEKNEKKGIYIHCPADPKDSWVSTSDPNLKNWDTTTLAAKWIDLNSVAIRDLRRNRSENAMVIDYRRMVAEPAHTLTDIFNFLDLSSFRIDLQNTVSDRKPYNTNTGGNPLDDWKTRLSDEDIKAIELVKAERAADYHFIQRSLERH